VSPSPSPCWHPPWRRLTLPRRSRLPSPTRCSVAAAPRSDNNGAVATSCLNECRRAGRLKRADATSAPPLPRGRTGAATSAPPAPRSHGLSPAATSQPPPRALCPTPRTHGRHERPALPHSRMGAATSAPPWPATVLGASVATAATCALPHAADARAVLDASSVGAAASDPPHPRDGRASPRPPRARAGELCPGHRDGTRASSTPWQLR